MSCKLEDRRPDWKSYALGELDARARQEAESHVSACADCQDELAGLRVTLDAMATLREEELPRRIAFVSDKVFERGWLFSGRIEKANLVEDVPISAVVATASGEDYAEWCRYLAQRKPFASKPGTNLKAEYEQWLLARARRRSAPTSHERPTRRT